VAVAERPVATKRRVVFTIVAVALFMNSIDQTMIATALPTLGRDLGASVNWSAWTISIYSLGMILAMPIGGKISDQIGRKRVFLTALGVFTVSSLCCGLATDIRMLVVFRGIEALGAGVFLPSASGIVGDEFPENRDRVIASFTSIFPVGAMVGPVIGAFIVAHWSWRATFLVNVPVGIALLLLGLRFFAPSVRRGSARIDFGGIALLGAALLATLYGFGRLGDGRAGLPTALAAIGGGLVLVVAFLRHARVFPRAVVPIQFLRGRTFGLMNALNFLFGTACLGMGALVPLYAQDRYGMDIVSSGTLLTARAVGIFSVAALTVMILRRTGYRLPMVVGFVIVAVGLAMSAVRPPSPLSPYIWLAAGTAVAGVGMGVFMPPANNATLHKDPSQIAAITGLRGMFRQIGLLFGVSLTTAIVASSDDPGLAQAWMYGAMAIAVLAALPVIMLVPDHRGKW
jgi:EmrB/QacA subfamily drug resistance transporter